MKKSKKTNNHHDLSVMFFQLALLLGSMLVWLYVFNNSEYSYLFCFIYPLIAASWVITMGNGRLSNNVEEIENIRDISSYKYKKFIHMPAHKEIIATIDFYCQVIGYVMIPFGLVLSIVIFFISNVSVSGADWSSFTNPYHIALISYLSFVFVASIIIRSFIYYKDHKWYKNKNKNKM